MRAAVAAGHAVTARAGAEVLDRGGNAVDAVVAAGAMSWAAEPSLTGPCGGGFLMVRRARGGQIRVVDAFTAIPGRDLPPGRRLTEVERVLVPFDEQTTQVFHIGEASCAVPGAPAGLAAVHEAYGRLPWPELVQPAIELARAGFELTRPQAHLHAILDLILRRIGTAVGNVVANGVVEQHHVLRHQTQNAAQAVLRHELQILSIDQHASFCGIIEAVEQFQDGRLARP